MLIYLLIGLGILLVGISVAQFFYMTYLGRARNLDDRRIRQLEKKSQRLRDDLDRAKITILKHEALVSPQKPKKSNDEEIWADVIDD